MGGLRKKMPVVFLTFLIGSASLSALPLVTAGFYSKDQILWYSIASGSGSTFLWISGIAGAFLTALYSFRMIFIVFFGEAKTKPSLIPGRLMTVPLIILAVLSVIGGFAELPESFGNFHLFSSLVDNTLPPVVIKETGHSEIIFQLLSSIIAVAGIYIAYLIYFKKPALSEKMNHSRINNFLEKGWGFDRLYDVIFVKPLVWLATIDKDDIFDRLNVGISRLALLFNGLLSTAQNGKLRWYLMSITVGIAFILTYMIFR
jgi:NADH-quinone oxidoreductase subunit L